MPERSPSTSGGDLLSVGIQAAVAIGAPLFIAAVVGDALDKRFGTTPWLGLVSILVGLGIAAMLSFLVVRRYVSLHPETPVSDAAREAGRRWQSELEEEERRREVGEKE